MILVSLEYTLKGSQVTVWYYFTWIVFSRIAKEFSIYQLLCSSSKRFNYLFRRRGEKTKQDKMCNSDHHSSNSNNLYWVYGGRICASLSVQVSHTKVNSSQYNNIFSFSAVGYSTSTHNFPVAAPYTLLKVLWYFYWLSYHISSYFTSISWPLTTHWFNKH